MKARWTIRRVAMENFRAYKGRHELEFGQGMTLLHGRIGAGKTSIFYAIEYALFGSVMETKERVARLTDLISEGRDFALVEVELANGDGSTLLIRRVLRSSGAERVEGAVDGRIIRSERDLKAAVKGLLGIDDDLYERAIYVSHRSLEALLHGPRQRRTLAIDRLFGVDAVEGLLRSLPLDSVTERLQRERDRLAAIEARKEVIERYGGIDGMRGRLAEIEGEMSRIRRSIESLEAERRRLLEEKARAMSSIRAGPETYEKYVRARMEYDELRDRLDRLGGYPAPTLEHLTLRLDSLRARVLEVAEEVRLFLDGQILDELRLAQPEHMEKALDAIYKAVRDIRDSVLPRLEAQLEDIRDRRVGMAGELESLSREVAALESKVSSVSHMYEAYRRILGKWGDVSRLRDAVERLSSEVAELESRTLLSRSLYVVARHLVETHGEACPICGNRIDPESVRRRFDELVETYMRLDDELRSRRAMLEEARSELGELERVLPAVNEYLGYREVLEDRLRSLAELKKRLTTAERSAMELERKIRRVRTLVEEVERELGGLEAAYEAYRIRRRISELEAELREHEERLEGMGASPGALARIEEDLSRIDGKLEAQYNALKALMAEREAIMSVLVHVGDEDLGTIVNRAARLEALHAALLRIQGALKTAQSNARRRVVDVLRDHVDSMFAQLYPYGDLRGAYLEAEPRGDKVYYQLYAFSSGAARLPISKLSDGQRLTLALALVLAIYKSADHNVAFLLMDEPILYVDEKVRRTFVDVLRRLLESGIVAQVVLATQSRELADQAARSAPSKIVQIIREGLEPPKLGYP